MTDTSNITLPDFVHGPIDRLTLALYAGASGDHTLIHLDPDAARSVGLPDVIGHGLLSMAIMGRALKHWFGFREAKSLAVRFSAPVFLGDMIRCAGSVASSKEDGDGIEYALDLIGYANDRKILTGSATVRVPA
jgi:acyl dehydratase